MASIEIQGKTYPLRITLRSLIALDEQGIKLDGLGGLPFGERLKAMGHLIHGALPRHVRSDFTIDDILDAATIDDVNALTEAIGGATKPNVNVQGETKGEAETPPEAPSTLEN